MSTYEDYKKQEVVFSFERDNDNYFALVWNDPNTIEVRNTEQLMRFFESIKKDNDGEYVNFCRSGKFDSSSPKEIFEFLVKNFDSSLGDEDGFLTIRCLAMKY